MDVTALGKKLCSTLFVWELMFLNLFQEPQTLGVLGGWGLQPYEPGCHMLSPGVGVEPPQSPVRFPPPGPRPSCLAQCSFRTTVALRLRMLSVVAV